MPPISNQRSNQWVTNPKPNPDAQLRLFCFSYAGGGTTLFHSWRDALPATVELRPIRLPGRESRLSEKPFTRFADLIEPLTQGILPLLDKPFAFYGHSMGSLVAFEVARRLRRLGLAGERGPRHLLVSGCRAPHLPDPEPAVGHLSDAEFISNLRRLNGTPQAVFDNPEILELLLPCIRADFQAVESYRFQEDAPLAIAITAFAGSEDGKADEPLMEPWSQHTTGNFALHMLPGDHFFIHNQQAQFLHKLSAALVG